MQRVQGEVWLVLVVVVEVVVPLKDPVKDELSFNFGSKVKIKENFLTVLNRIKKRVRPQQKAVAYRNSPFSSLLLHWVRIPPGGHCEPYICYLTKNFNCPGWEANMGSFWFSLIFSLTSSALNPSAIATPHD